MSVFSLFAAPCVAHTFLCEHPVKTAMELISRSEQLGAFCGLVGWTDQQSSSFCCEIWSFKMLFMQNDEVGFSCLYVHGHDELLTKKFISLVGNLFYLIMPVVHEYNSLYLLKITFILYMI